MTHFHMDHAGLIGEFIKLGIRCLVLDFQVSAIDEMERIIKKNTEYKEYVNIEKENLIISSPKIVNNDLALHNFDVYIESLNSHSDDHIGVFVGQGEVIIGDLAPINQIMDDDKKANENWKRIIAKSVKVAYPSHADVITL